MTGSFFTRPWSLYFESNAHATSSCHSCSLDHGVCIKIVIIKIVKSDNDQLTGKGGKRYHLVDRCGVTITGGQEVREGNMLKERKEIKGRSTFV